MRDLFIRPISVKSITGFRHAIFSHACQYGESICRACLQHESEWIPFCPRSFEIEGSTQNDHSIKSINLGGLQCPSASPRISGSVGMVMTCLLIHSAKQLALMTVLSKGKAAIVIFNCIYLSAVPFRFYMYPLNPKY